MKTNDQRRTDGQGTMCDYLLLIAWFVTVAGLLAPLWMPYVIR